MLIVGIVGIVMASTLAVFVVPILAPTTHVAHDETPLRAPNIMPVFSSFCSLTYGRGLM